MSRTTVESIKNSRTAVIAAVAAVAVAASLQIGARNRDTASSTTGNTPARIEPGILPADRAVAVTEFLKQDRVLKPFVNGAADVAEEPHLPPKLAADFPAPLSGDQAFAPVTGSIIPSPSS